MGAIDTDATRRRLEEQNRKAWDVHANHAKPEPGCWLCERYGVAKVSRNEPGAKGQP